MCSHLEPPFSLLLLPVCVFVQLWGRRSPSSLQESDPDDLRSSEPETDVPIRRPPPTPLTQNNAAHSEPPGQPLPQHNSGNDCIALSESRSVIKKEHLTIEEHNRGLTFMSPQVGRRPPGAPRGQPRISFQDIVIKCRQRPGQPVHIFKMVWRRM